jgi:electron transport complex protein RnfC
MSKVFAFHGGIHPPENKHQSTQSPIADGPIAKTLHVPLQQHIGVAAKPCVTVGESVLKGQRIADAQGKFSVPIHAPSSGVVSDISQRSVPHPSGMQGLCISIETDGLDQWIEHTGLADYPTLGKDQLIDYICDRGIAGMGGAGFPTAVKLHLGDDHIVNTLIINAAECEPYITADDLLMRERAEQIISGINVLQFLLEPSHIIIGIEDNKPQAIRALEIATQHCKYNIDVVSVPTKYPSGGEKQLIKLLTNIEVPNGGIPADVGIVCQNVGTVYAIHRAVHFGESLISRIVTVTGDGVKKPQNYDTLIGTPFSELLNAAGYIKEKTHRLIVGGPMMGYSIQDDQIPVVKTSNCIIASTRDEMPEQPPSQACIRCGMCEQVCPVQLLPQQLHWFAKGQEYQKAEEHNLFDCIECGACSYVCPSNIPLVQYYRHAKTSIKEEQQEKRKSDLARERFEAKQMREQRAIDEKAAKRKARAEQAAKAQAEKKQQAQDTDNSNGVDQKTLLKNNLKDAKTALADIEKEITANSGTEQSNNIAAQDIQLQKAKAAVEQAKQAIVKSSEALEPSIDTKKLKREAAMANTKLAKAKQALKNAQEKDQPGIEQLTATIETLSKQADIANSAFEKALQDSPQITDDTAGTTKAIKPKTTDAESKKLKTAAAIARTKLKKAQTSLQTAQENGEATEQLNADIKLLEDKLNTAQSAYEASQASAQKSDTINHTNDDISEDNSNVDVKKLKTAAAIARTKLKKAQSQLEKLTGEESNSEEAETIKATIADLEQRVEKTQAHYLKHKSAQPADAQNEQSDMQQHQEDYDKALKLYTKAMAALNKAREQNSPAVEKMAISIEKLKRKLDDAQAALSDQKTAVSSNNDDTNPSQV